MAGLEEHSDLNSEDEALLAEFDLSVAPSEPSEESDFDVERAFGEVISNKQTVLTEVAEVFKEIGLPQIELFPEPQNSEKFPASDNQTVQGIGISPIHNALFERREIELSRLSAWDFNSNPSNLPVVRAPDAVLPRQRARIVASVAMIDRQFAACSEEILQRGANALLAHADNLKERQYKLQLKIHNSTKRAMARQRPTPQVAGPEKALKFFAKRWYHPPPPAPPALPPAGKPRAATAPPSGSAAFASFTGADWQKKFSDASLKGVFISGAFSLPPFPLPLRALHVQSAPALDLALLATRFPKLRVLQISDTPLGCIAVLPKGLVSLSLVRCAVPEIEELALPKLVELELPQNELKKISAKVAAPRLLRASFPANELSEIPAFLQTCGGLVELVLRQNNIHGAVSACFGCLEALDLEENHVTSVRGFLPSLRLLVLSFNDVDAPRELRRLRGVAPGLRTLTLTDNPVMQDPAAWPTLSSFPGLQDVGGDEIVSSERTKAFRRSQLPFFVSCLHTVRLVNPYNEPRPSAATEVFPQLALETMHAARRRTRAWGARGTRRVDDASSPPNGLSEPPQILDLRAETAFADAAKDAFSTTLVANNSYTELFRQDEDACVRTIARFFERLHIRKLAQKERDAMKLVLKKPRQNKLPAPAIPVHDDSLAREAEQRQSSLLSELDTIREKLGQIRPRTETPRLQFAETLDAIATKQEEARPKPPEPVLPPPRYQNPSPQVRIAAFSEPLRPISSRGSALSSASSVQRSEPPGSPRTQRSDVPPPARVSSPSPSLDEPDLSWVDGLEGSDVDAFRAPVIEVTSSSPSVSPTPPRVPMLSPSPSPSQMPSPREPRLTSASPEAPDTDAWSTLPDTPSVSIHPQVAVAHPKHKRVNRIAEEWGMSSETASLFLRVQRRNKRLTKKKAPRQMMLPPVVAAAPKKKRMKYLKRKKTATRRGPN
eukprot:gnl/Chilomastix_cuspidata/6185.p1 GENE.gnl/Chilomastix_cuspidata/6185~~gnl/Chilomastix_cuspidata/6185.p1  ORF type:complete len:950 (+),score=79.60 gnl/Chilomastix_cuspidata/6185:40-2889(+)